MAKATTVRITPLLRPVLDGLARDLHAAGMQIGSKDQIPQALLWSARYLPIEVIKGAVEAYVKAELAASSPPPDDPEPDVSSPQL